MAHSMLWQALHAHCRHRMHAPHSPAWLQPLGAPSHALSCPLVTPISPPSPCAWHRDASAATSLAWAAAPWASASIRVRGPERHRCMPLTYVVAHATRARACALLFPCARTCTLSCNECLRGCCRRVWRACPACQHATHATMSECQHAGNAAWLGLGFLSFELQDALVWTLSL